MMMGMRNKDRSRGEIAVGLIAANCLVWGMVECT